VLSRQCEGKGAAKGALCIQEGGGGGPHAGRQRPLCRATFPCRTLWGSRNFGFDFRGSGDLS
jgi:hypothetical protein